VKISEWLCASRALKTEMIINCNKSCKTLQWHVCIEFK